MKKVYVKPSIKAHKVNTNNIMCASGYPPPLPDKKDDWGDKDKPWGHKWDKKGCW